MTYRKVKKDEINQIAALHAQSWQVAYKGILSDDFLDSDVFNNRLELWTERFAKREKNRWIYVAVEKNVLQGFVCVYGDDEEEWGALVDNLHVLPHLKGKGIGKRLLQEASKWIWETYKTPEFYLWVYRANHTARAFYEKMGGENVEEDVYEGPDNSLEKVLRYVWYKPLINNE